MFYSARRFYQNVRFLCGKQHTVTAGQDRGFREKVWYEVLIQGVVTATLLTAGLYILLKHSSDSALREAAAGWIGGVIGYWLR